MKRNVLTQPRTSNSSPGAGQPDRESCAISWCGTGKPFFHPNGAVCHLLVPLHRIPWYQQNQAIRCSSAVLASGGRPPQTPPPGGTQSPPPPLRGPRGTPPPP